MKRDPKFTINQARKLKVCLFCQTVGIYRPSHDGKHIPLVVCVQSNERERYSVERPARSYAHPRCLIDRMSLKKFLSLHTEELETVRENDVPKSVMKLIGEELARRRA